MREPGRLYAMDGSGTGELIIERPGVYPNGIAFDGQGRLYWTESMGHRVCRLENGHAAVFVQLSDGHVPDGMAFAADGRAFVCTTISGGLTVLSPEGEVLEEITIGECATNCIFDGPRSTSPRRRSPISASARRPARSGALTPMRPAACR